jgi:hypothetical protein
MTAFTNDELYGPCPCGSGKKLKFCCRETLTRRAPAAEEAAIQRAWDLVEMGDFAGVAAIIEPFIAQGSRSAHARVVLAVERAVGGDLDEAIGLCREAWSVLAPGQVYAGGLLAHLLVMKGDTVEAGAILDRILKVPIRHGTDAYAVTAALALLERDRDLVALAHGVGDDDNLVVAVAGGIAALNLGDRATARTLLTKARAKGKDPTLLLMLRQTTGPVVTSPWGRFEPLMIGNFGPAATGLLLTEQAADGRFHDDVAMSRVVARMLRQSVLIGQDVLRPELVEATCASIAALHPDVARAELQTLWESAHVPSSTAMIAAQAALQAGLITADTDLQLVINGVPKVGRVARRDFLPNPALMAEVYDLPAHLDVVERQALGLQREGRHVEAIALLDTILAELPGHPSTVFNRLVCQVKQGHISVPEQIAALKALLTRVPRYLVARQTLASIFIATYHFDDAAAVLTEAHLAEALTPEQCAQVARSLALIAAGEERDADAKRLALMAAAFSDPGELKLRDPLLAKLAAGGKGPVRPTVVVPATRSGTDDDELDDDDVVDDDVVDDDFDEAPARRTDHDVRPSTRWQVMTIEPPPVPGVRMFHVAAVVDGDTGRILGLHLDQDGNMLTAVAEALEKAEASAGGPPQHVALEDVALMSVVQANTHHADVEVGPCVLARRVCDEFLGSFEKAAQQDIKSTWRVRGIPITQARDFHVAAAAFAKRKPWDVIPDDRCALVMTSSDGLLAGAVVVVTGGPGRVCGLTVHCNTPDIPDPMRPGMFVSFGSMEETPSTLAAEIKHHMLPVANSTSVPLLNAFAEGSTTVTPTATDAERCRLAMRVVEHLVCTKAKNLRAWRTREPRPGTVTIDGVTVKVTCATDRPERT